MSTSQGSGFRARATEILRTRRPFVLALPTIGIGLAVLAPLLVWGTVVRQTVVTEVERREAEQRILSAELASRSIYDVVREAGSRLELFSSQKAFVDDLKAQDQAALERQLARLARGARFGSALALDPEGRLLARSPATPDLYGQSFADRDYYRGALASEAPYVSEVYASRAAESPPSVAIAFTPREPIPIGIVVVTLEPAHLLDILRPLLATEGRRVELVDASGLVVVGTDPLRPPLSDSRLSGLTLAALGQRGTTTTRIDGAERVVTFAAVAVARWTLFISDDPAVVNASQDRLNAQLAVGGGLAVLLALVAASAISWLYSTSVRQRAELADRELALRSANLELAVVSGRKSDYLAGMSHELRTPLNAILGFSDLLEEQLRASLSDRQKRYLRHLREAGQHLLALIDDVLDLSKVEAGRVELRPEPTTLDTIVAPIVSSTRAAAETAGLSFRAEVDGGLQLVADVARVRQILYNLLSNAVKFTPAGGEVALRAGRTANALRIEVRDTGIGIPAERRDQVFRTFERLHEGRSDAPGTGLGLALTKSLVELHAGTVTFESIEGQGTTFRVSLPDLVAVVAA